MSNGNSQTSTAVDGEDKLVDGLNDNGAKRSNQPKQVFDDESGIISFIKSISPGLRGDNSAYLRAQLIKDEKLLDRVATRILDNSVKGSEELAQQYQTDTELYEDHKQAVKDRLEKLLTTDVVKGESTRKSIVDRTYKLKTSDLSSLRKPKFVKSEYDSIINRESKKHGIDPRLVKAIIQQESGFDPKARSSKGAIGLMQLMPDTAKELGVNPEDPEDNIKGGIAYLADQIKKADTLEVALAAYNAGPNNEEVLQGKVPEIKETKDYIGKVIGNYQELIKPSMEFDLPISEYIGVALDNKEKYQNLGILDAEGNFKYDTEEGAKIFLNKLLENENLHKELIGDRYDVFLGKLENSNNTGAIDESNPDDMARAWAVYDKFGSEGLTHFLNIQQHYAKGQPLEEQDPKVKQAISYIKNTSQDGFTVQNYIGTFFGAENSPVGKFEITPVTRSLELKEEVEKDLNNFTRYFDYGSNQGPGFQEFLSKLKLKSNKRETEKGFLAKAWDSFVNTVPKAKPEQLDQKPSLVEAVTGIMGGATTVVTNDQTFTGSPSEQAYHDLVNGLDTTIARGAKLEILREAKSDEGSFSIQDLMRTIISNAEDHEEIPNSTLYKINYEDANERTRIAIDTLRVDPEYRNMFHTAKDGSLLFEPKYYQRIAQDENVRPLVSMKWEKKIVTDDQGNAVGYVETPGEQNMGEGLTQILGNVGYTFSKLIDEFAVKPGSEMLFGAIDSAQEVFGEELFSDVEIDLKRKYEKNWREFFDAPLQAQMNMDDVGDWISSGSRFGIPFAVMLTAMSKMGTKGVKAPWNYVKQMAKARSQVTGEAASVILGRKSATKMGAFFKKMHTDASMKQGVTHRFLKYSLGGIPIETLAGEHWSILGTGLGDLVIEGGLDKLGAEVDTDIQKAYQTSDRLTQIGMDVFTYEIAGLLIDNALAGIKYGTSQFARGLGRKSFRGVEFDYGSGEFAEVTRPMFASDSRRTFHNLTNGLQDIPLGNMGESLANRYTGRAILSDPTNKETLSDVVVGFSEEAQPILGNAKRIISDAVDYYDERLGGKLRLSQAEKDARVEQIYDDFFTNVAKRIKQTVESTGGGEETPLKIASLIERQAPSIKGSVPYIMEDGTPKHLMTIAEAEELAEQSSRYIVKPAENGKFARVFEVDDGLWTTVLSDKLRGLYKGTTIDEAISRQFERLGIGRSASKLTQEQQEQRGQVETAMRRVYGQEVTLENGRTGVVVDAGDDGFVVMHSDGSLRSGVQIDEYSEQLEVLGGKHPYTKENFEEVTEGGAAEPTGNRIDNVGDVLARDLRDLYPNVNAQARGMINAAAEGDLPSSTSDEMLQIARDNGVKAGINDNPEQIVRRLIEKGQGKKIKDLVKRALDANDKAVRFSLLDDSRRYVPASASDEVFQKSGLGTNFMRSINKFAKYAKERAGTARSIAKLLGVDNTDGYSKIGKNLAPISRFNPEKIGKDGLKTNFVFLKNSEGVDEHFINVRSINSEDTPSVWIRNEAGNLVYNPKWRRIEPNVTVADDGSLPLYTPVEIGNETWYRVAQEGEDGVMINVQKPTKSERLSLEQVRRRGIDAVEKEIDGEIHYRLVNEQQQAIDPTLIKGHPKKAYNATSTVKAPGQAGRARGEKEAIESVQETVKEAGLGRSLAYGMAGAIVDNILGTTGGDPNQDDGINLGLFTLVGAALGNRWVRNKFVQTYQGVLKKPIKNLFDKDFSTLYKVQKDVDDAKTAAKTGLAYDPRNKYEQATLKSLKDFASRVKESSKNTWKNVKQHEYVMSSLSLIKNIDHPKATKFFQALETMNESINEIASTAPRRFSGFVQDLKGKIDDSLYNELNTADSYQKYLSDIAPRKVQELFPNKNLSRVEAKEQFDLAFFRLKNSGARLEEGELVQEPPSNVQSMYDDATSPDPVTGRTRGEEWQLLDRQLMNDQVFRAFLESHKNFYNKVMERWMTQLNRRIDGTFAILPDNVRDPFREFLDSKMTYKQWFDTLADRDQKIVRQLKKNKNVQDLIGYHNTKQRFRDLSGRYYPQIPSDTKTQTALRRFIAREGLEDLPVDDQREAFNQYMADKMYALNHTKSERRFLREYNSEAKSFDVKYYNSREEAEVELSNISSHLRATDDYKEHAQRIERNKQDFVGSREVEVREDGELKLDDNGDPITKDVYFLRVPDDFDENVFDIRTKGFEANRKGYRDFYKDVTNHAFVRTSNFLERPRVRNLPHEILETDINTVRRRYSTDVGRRIHNAENNMFDNKELRAEYLSDVEKHLKDLGHDKDYRDYITNRMINMYNIQNNIIDKTGRELRKEARWRSVVDLFKNALFSRFGFGFGWYNMFEWAVVGPHLTSGSEVYNTAKLFTTNKQALNNTERLLRTWDIVRKEIGSVNPDFERYGLMTDDNLLNSFSNVFTKTANYIGDFSVTKNLGGKVFGWDVRDWGMARLATDSFMGSNYVSTSIVTQSALGEARYIANVLRQFDETGEEIIRANGKAWTRPEASRKLELLGIAKSKQEDFIARSQEFGEAIEKIRSTEELSLEDFSKATLDDHTHDIFKIMQRATENFHGTNKMYRPEGWNSPVGKALSTYSTYPFNFSMQTVSRRVRQPISDWFSTYGDQLKGGRTTNAMKMMYNLKQGNTQALRNMGLSDEAIQNIPVDAYRGILKHLGSTLGISTAGLLSIDAINDLLAYPINDALGQEQWQRLRYRNILNPSARKEDQMTWQDVDDEFGLDSFMNVSHYMLGTLARSSFFGRYGDILEQQQRLSREGILSLTPLTGMADQTFKDVMDIGGEPLSGYPITLTNKSLKFLINNSPVLGSNVFGELRKALYEQVKFKREKNGEEPLRFIDETTGEELDIENFNTRLE